MDKILNCKKAFIFSTLATISTTTDKIDLTQNSLVAVTAAGIITGTYVSDQMKGSLKNDPSYLTFQNIGNMAQKGCDDTQNAILLRDATLTTNQGFKSCFSYLFVFIEDIIALSYGNIETN